MLKSLLKPKTLWFKIVQGRNADAGITPTECQAWLMQGQEKFEFNVNDTRTVLQLGIAGPLADYKIET